MPKGNLPEILSQAMLVGTMNNNSNNNSNSSNTNSSNDNNSNNDSNSDNLSREIGLLLSSLSLVTVLITIIDNHNND